MPIITSILDLDLYKLTVGNLLFSLFPNVVARYEMKVRNGKEIDYCKYVPLYQFQEETKSLANLSLTEEEANYLRSLNLFTEDYITFLSNNPLTPLGELFWGHNHNDINCPMPYAVGKWVNVMLYETLLASIGNELYARNYCAYNQIEREAMEQTASLRFGAKTDKLIEYNKTLKEKVNLIEFGTRRRMSQNWQMRIIVSLRNMSLISGTSNVNFARLYNMPVRGTFGHEFVMGCQALYRIQDSQRKAFELWLEHYKGKLAIALNDTLGTTKFLVDFDEDLAMAYDGLRHDSGDPIIWGEQMLHMYSRYGIPVADKTLFFSDGLDFDKMIAIHKHFSKKCDIKLAFGIGTNLTNDSFIPVPQTVMKMSHCQSQPVAKLSNNPAKATCPSAEYLEYIKWVAEKL